jgi:hypothetical protein
MTVKEEMMFEPTATFVNRAMAQAYLDASTEERASGPPEEVEAMRLAVAFFAEEAERSEPVTCAVCRHVSDREPEMVCVAHVSHGVPFRLVAPLCPACAAKPPEIRRAAVRPQLLEIIGKMGGRPN